EQDPGAFQRWTCGHFGTFPPPPYEGALSGRQANGGGGLSRQSFPAAGETEAFRGGRLDAHPTGGNSKNIGDPRLHGRAMRSDLRRFADQGHVQVSNDAAPARDKRCRMLEENGGVRTAPALVRRREGGADVAFADGAKDGVRQG